MKIVTIISLIIISFVGLIALLGSVLSRGQLEQNFIDGEAFFNEGKYKEAIQSLESFIEQSPRDSKATLARYYLARSYEELGDHEKALQFWSEFVKLSPNDTRSAEGYYYIGLSQENAGKLDEAITNYNLVIENFQDSPVYVKAVIGLGRIHELKGKESEAINLYSKLISERPEFATEAQLRLGNINLKRFLQENAIPYKVKRGETLVSIARKFKITPELIMKLSGLNSNKISAGQVVKVIDGSNFNILVDLSERKLALRSGDKLVKMYLVCVGKKETPTPTGNYKVINKAVDPVWFSGPSTGNKGIIPGGDPRNELGSRWIGFKPAYGIHGTIFPESIGKAESHGCIRMLNKDVEELYDLVCEGTPVKIVE